MNNNIIIDNVDLINCSSRLILPKIPVIKLTEPVYIRQDYYMYNAIPTQANLTVTAYKKYMINMSELLNLFIIEEVPLLKRCLDTCNFLISDNNMKHQIGIYYEYLKSVSSRFSLYLKYIYFRRDYYRNIIRGFSLGDIGERLTNSVLELDDRFLQTGDITLSYNNRVSQIDNIVLTNNGVFICEVKNIGSLSNSTIYINSTGQWYLNTSDGKTVPLSITSQHNAHTSLVSNIFLNNKNTCSVIPISVYIIANDNVQVINKCRFINICRSNDIRDLLLSLGNTVLDNKDKFNIGYVLSKYSIAERVISFKDEVSLDKINIISIKEQVDLFMVNMDKYYPFVQHYE